MLIVLTGPASSGKDTILTKLLGEFPKFKKVVTTTTRVPRKGEVAGKDYNFVSKQEFDEIIRNGQMLEYVDFTDGFYGTTKEAVNPIHRGENLIWRVETSRAANIKDVLPPSIVRQSLVIYINPTDWQVLKSRMRKRGMSEAMINVRLKKDREDFIKYKSSLQHIVDNEEGKLDETLFKIEQLIQNFY